MTETARRRLPDRRDTDTAARLDEDEKNTLAISEGIPGNPIDLRLAFLARASAWLLLIETGAADLDEAFNALKLRAPVLPCRCERKILDNWERTPRPRDPRRRAA
jgi:hypothetical protein